MSKRDKLIINWQFVCLNLRTHYKSLSAISFEVGSDWQHLNRLARGEVMEAGFSVGIRLLDLHVEHCPGLHKGVLIDDSLLD